jgi:1-aminocyclopropane-1-carboxylate deaminase
VTAFFPDLNNFQIDQWKHPLFGVLNLKVDVLRLDKIHPEISGNKWFKLKYYLERARHTNKLNLMSYGGAYSNHLLALASAASIYGLKSVGLIRGEKPDHLSSTLIQAKALGMELRFLSRSEFKRQKNLALFQDLSYHDTNTLIIPEGGSGPEGVRGAEEILSGISIEKYTHFCCAVGTGTTMIGIINSTGPNQKTIGISVLKGTRNLEPLDLSWLKKNSDPDRMEMIHEDHFGGYAKYTKELIDFMNETYMSSGIPTDFVYTAKLFFSVVRMAGLNSFAEGSHILVLHTGGLAGNHSLTPGLLQF